MSTDPTSSSFKTSGAPPSSPSPQLPQSSPRIPSDRSPEDFFVAAERSDTQSSLLELPKPEDNPLAKFIKAKGIQFTPEEKKELATIKEQVADRIIVAFKKYVEASKLTSPEKGVSAQEEFEYHKNIYIAIDLLAGNPKPDKIEFTKEQTQQLQTLVKKSLDLIVENLEKSILASKSSDAVAYVAAKQAISYYENVINETNRLLGNPNHGKLEFNKEQIKELQALASKSVTLIAGNLQKKAQALQSGNAAAARAAEEALSYHENIINEIKILLHKASVKQK